MERELGKATALFEAARGRVDRFRAERPDTMPDQKDSVLERLRRLDAAARDQETLAGTSGRLAQEYERLLRQTPRDDRAQRAPTAEEVQLDLQLRGSQTALDEARQAAATARTKYTEKHPAIQRIAGEIASLEAAVARSREGLGAARARADEQAAERRGADAQDWMTSLDRMRRGAVEDSKAAAEAARGIREEMDALHARLAAMPATEAAFRPVRSSYDEAAKVKEDRERDARNARSAVDFYATTDAADFTGFDVKERAVVPARPAGPQRWRFLAAAAGGGVLLGCLLLGLSRRARERTVVGYDDVEALLPAALVVSVPLPAAGVVPRVRRLAREAALAGYVALLFGATAFVLAARGGLVSVPAWARPFLGDVA